MLNPVGSHSSDMPRPAGSRFYTKLQFPKGVGATTSNLKPNQQNMPASWGGVATAQKCHQWPGGGVEQAWPPCAMIWGLVQPQNSILTGVAQAAASLCRAEHPEAVRHKDDECDAESNVQHAPFPAQPWTNRGRTYHVQTPASDVSHITYLPSSLYNS